MIGWIKDYFLDINYTPIWWVSQFFAFLALIFSVWAFQVKEKIKLLLLTGIFSLFLAVSASLLENYTLGVLFGLAAVRNFVFSYLDWRIKQGVKIDVMIKYIWAGAFAFSTISATVILVYFSEAIFGAPIKSVGAWLEWLICVTLLGLIVGNVLKGTVLMRCSFMANRVFNIINHAHFNNLIAVVIAISAITSNVVYYIRQFFSWRKKKKNQSAAEDAPA
jgi:hypothetical protein